MLFSEQKIAELLHNHYGLSGQLKALPGYVDQNALVKTDSATYVVKFSHGDEPLISLQMQNEVMSHLHRQQLAVPKALDNQQGAAITHLSFDDGTMSYMRVLSFLPGDFYADAKPDKHNGALWQHLGEFMAQVNVSLEGFDHPGAYRNLDWDLAHGYKVCMSKKSVLDEPQLALVERFLAEYQIHTLSLLWQLPTGLIHNDANDYNLLIDDTNKPSQITGLIDFGDAVHSHLVNELAITAAYAMLSQDDPIATLATLCAGYHSIRPLSETERQVLFSLVALRLCVSVCNSSTAIKQQPDNEYLLISAKPAWALLKKMAKMNAFAVSCRIAQACGVEVEHGQDAEAIIDVRQKHLSKTLSLNYQQPLKIVRGQGAYLIDEQGNDYLDMVNNVCHVGHCHPKVVAAGQKQMAELNTNTRFLHDNLVDYAQKLLATMPDELSVVMFVNSGSEANELAMRLAKCYTGSKELICVDGAYHGNTAACITASPYKFNGPGGEGPQAHIHTVKLPDPYRGEFTTAQGYVDNVRQMLGSIAEQGKQVGGFICESLHGVAGQIVMPDGYLEGVYAQVRGAGGVCIADEVQVGFGRVGSHMWAFETQGVVPDIVSLGKPIGNGHPLGAVVTTQAIADAFVTGMEYFNTFGGNPVSTAIGLAVLETIEQDKLQQNALETGNYLTDKLKQLQLDHEIIGDVRGMGLFIGVELVEERQSKAPATTKTKALVEFAKARNILLSSDGPFNNVLKIKPPIVFDKHDADKFIAVFTDWLAMQ